MTAPKQAFNTSSPPEFETVTVSPALYRVQVERRYRKHPRLVMFEGGRYGTMWLRRLVYAMARKLGMLGHDRTFADVPVVTRSFLKGDFDRQFNQGVLNAMRITGLDPDNLEIVIGEDAFSRAGGVVQKDIRFRARTDVSVKCADREATMTWRGIDARIVPCMSGWAVIPKASQAEESTAEIRETWKERW